jgi:hypothetical protein
MDQRRYFSRLAVTFLLALSAFGMTAHAQAQSVPDDWQFRATIYGWFPGITGDTQFPSGAGGPSINVNANDLVSALKMAFMGTLEGRRGQWGGMVDWFYADVGDTKSATRAFSILGGTVPADLTANLSLDVKTNILTLAGTYALVERPQYSSSLVFGTRMLKEDQTLDWAFNTNGPLAIARNGRADVSATNWDAIIGAKGRASFGEGQRWFVPYYVDIGAGNSKFTWQGLVGLGYAFSWGDAAVAWRYIDYEFKSGEPVQSLTLNGIGAGVSFKF